MKKIFYSITWLVVGFTVAGLLFEGIVRVLGLSQQTANLYQSDPLIGSKHVPDGQGLWRKKEFQTDVQFNSEGFRDVNHTIDKPQDTYRIVVLGDSYVEAMQVPLEETFHKILEKKLNESLKHKKVEVINFGVSGFGIPQYYLSLKHYGYKYNPDMVILAVTTGNDIRNAHPDLELDNSKPYFLLDAQDNLYLRPFHVQGDGIGRFISDHIIFPQSYIFLAQTLGPLWWQLKAKKAAGKDASSINLDFYVYSEPYTKVWEDAWRSSLAVLSLLKKELDEKRIGFLVVDLTDGDSQINGTLQKYLEENGPRGIQWDAEKPIKILDEFCGKSKISFLPLLYDFRKEFNRTREKFHFIYDGHWNKRGHELAADSIYKKILNDIMIK